ncbi:hypothetical protein G7Y89_g1748 [Cudoniella acicularis]|uniref:Essential protein Yae1 N-terminal domain-containing protein n=1 Tax=Cudoniella acicularis TaxID=354080 RepID=A0A8H4W6P7_9HELO|nr:hypothetical protein G7Y89_g1748 [Cudoniella acicularis]
MPSSTFDEILDLEEKFYDDGYQQGLADGVKAGRIEGRTFGLEKGFEKYLESGKLHGKSLVWVNRMPCFPAKFSAQDANQQSKPDLPANDQPQKLEKLPSLPDNQRLAKHLKVLYALAESESLSTENTEEAVSDFDDRLKRAQAKAKIVERMVGEAKDHNEGAENVVKNNEGNIEDASLRNTKG